MRVAQAGMIGASAGRCAEALQEPPMGGTIAVYGAVTDASRKSRALGRGLFRLRCKTG